MLTWVQALHLAQLAAALCKHGNYTSCTYSAASAAATYQMLWVGIATCTWLAKVVAPASKAQTECAEGTLLGVTELSCFDVVLQQLLVEGCFPTRLAAGCMP